MTTATLVAFQVAIFAAVVLNYLPGEKACVPASPSHTFPLLLAATGRQFSNYDDPENYSDNPHINEVSIQNLKWIMTPDAVLVGLAKSASC